MTAGDTAEALGSGDVPVLATPRLIAWMEAATVAACAGSIADGSTTVGAEVRVRHLQPTPVGGTVDVTAQVTSSPGTRRITFAVLATDDSGTVVGDGEIERVVVARDEFVRGVRSA